MAKFFYNLGKMTGPVARKGQWVWKSLTGSEEEAIEAEHQVGRDLAAAVKEQLGVLTQSMDPKRSEWIDQMGDALAARVLNKHRKFSFIIADMDEPNAFALPGGFIFLGRSLLDLCKWDRDEVAFVMAHEMGHVVKGHSIDRIMNNAAISAASRALPAAGVLVGWIKSAGVKVLQSAYSQDNEFEADHFALRVVAAAGLSPRGGVRLMERLKEFSKSPVETALGEYLTTHPPFDERIARMNSMIK